MNVTRETYRWSTVGKGRAEGKHPYPGIARPATHKDIQIHFCFYSDKTTEYKNDAGICEPFHVKKWTGKQNI